MNIRRNFRRHRRSLGGVTLLLGVAILFAVVCSPLAVRASVAKKQLPIYCVQRDDKCVSLTFDAAWGDVILRHAPGDLKVSVAHRAVTTTVKSEVSFS